MKEITLIYTGTWNTSIQVPDDFDPTHENIQALADANCGDFDFTDGGADWYLDPVDSFMSNKED